MKQEIELYIHIPFCVKKCHYCDFLSGPADEGTKERYMEALFREIQEKSLLYRDFDVTSVFIGGGTPTCVNALWIEKLMKLLKQQFCLKPDAEISLEMNPGTADKSALQIYYNAGINRLSIGLQSAKHEELTVLGRIHNFEQFLEAYMAAREIGYSNINVDIMSGLPGQIMEDYTETLQKVTELQPPPEHISAYSLIVEEGTRFYDQYEKGMLKLPDEETDRAMYLFTGQYLHDKGYVRYEISNYAKKGYECRHNLGYWKRKNYVGFGMGAASLVHNIRFKNGEKLQEYIHNPCDYMVEQETLSVKEQMEETMFLGLRLTEGVSYAEFEKSFGVSLDTIYGSVIEKHIQEGLLENYRDESKQIKEDKRCLRLTLKGIDVSNYVMADFLEP